MIRWEVAEQSSFETTSETYLPVTLRVTSCIAEYLPSHSEKSVSCNVLVMCAEAMILPFFSPRYCSASWARGRKSGTFKTRDADRIR